MAVHAHTTARFRCVLIGLAVLWSLIGLPGPGSCSVGDNDNESSRATLKGLSGVYVLIEDLKPDAEQAGLTKQQLQTDVELRLRHAGIAVLTREESLSSSGRPYLYVQVNVWDSMGLFAFSISVELNQPAYLVHNFLHTFATTWGTGSIGTVGAAKLPAVREQVKDRVDNFINAYLSVNPRPPGSVAPPASSVASSRQTLIRQVQERLQAVGFTPGSIDGTVGPQTREALRWFQNTKGLLPTGEIDEKTLDALGVR